MSGWSQLLRVQPRGGGWVGWFLVYGVVHATMDIGGLTLVGRLGAPPETAYLAVVTSVLGGFGVAQGATVFARRLRARRS